MPAAAPSAPSAATPASARRRAGPMRPRGSAPRSGARAGGARSTPPPPLARAAGRAGRSETQSSRQAPPQLLEPVAAGRQHDVVDGQPAQLVRHTRASLGLDRGEAL